MKSRGGRAKKAQYTTVVMRIPTPIKAEVECLLADFYASLSEKPVTSIESVEVVEPVTGIISVEFEKGVTGIESLMLPNRLYKILKRCQINTVEDLKRWKRSDLQARPGIGDLSILNINTALIEQGYEPIP